VSLAEVILSRSIPLLLKNPAADNCLEFPRLVFSFSSSSHFRRVGWSHENRIRNSARIWFAAAATGKETFLYSLPEMQRDSIQGASKISMPWRFNNR
jgi:hypothetical protein